MNPRRFPILLTSWYKRNLRPLPWRETLDPYRIWISEIMLQQTRAQAVIPYYEKFLKRFPNVGALAQASEPEVLACWSGLGYYSRARNLRKAAQIVEREGFPREYESIRALPGVGPYTAAAIASIAFGRPHAVLDGNVMRVIARLRNDPGDIGSSATKARFQKVADELLSRRNAGRFNQAFMELGATVCLPKTPRCPLCPVSGYCQARAAGTASTLPVKLRPKRTVAVEKTLVLLERKKRLLLWQRPEESSLMPGFWELPEPDQIPGVRLHDIAGSFHQSITNRRYTIQVIRGAVPRTPRGLRWVHRSELGALPLSTSARKALKIAGG